MASKQKINTQVFREFCIKKRKVEEEYKGYISKRRKSSVHATPTIATNKVGGRNDMKINSPTEGNKTCEECKTNCEGSFKFCHNCGKALSKECERKSIEEEILKLEARNKELMGLLSNKNQLFLTVLHAHLIRTRQLKSAGKLISKQNTHSTQSAK